MSLPTGGGGGRRRGRRRPSLDQLLTAHQVELDLLKNAQAPVPEEEEAEDGLAGVRALYALVSKGEAMATSHVAAFVEKLGIVLAQERVQQLFDGFLSSKLEPPTPGGTAQAASLEVAGFQRMLRMIMTSDELATDAPDAQPLHKFPQHEVNQLRRIFKDMDKDNSGELDHDELAECLTTWGVENITEAEMETLVERFDVNRNGKLDFEEFLGIASAARAMSDGDDQSMEMTIRTHFAREHAKMKSLMVRQRMAVDAATLQFFKDEARHGATAQNSMARAAGVADRAIRDLGGDDAAAKKAFEHVRQRLAGELNERLLDAAEAGNTKEVQSLLQRGGDIKVLRHEPPRESCLLLALGARKDKTAIALLEAGADAAYEDEAGNGAVMAAAQAGLLAKSKKLLPLLIKGGAQLDTRDASGFSALLAVVQRGKVDEVDALLNAGADKDLADAEGSTPVMRAAQTGHKAIVHRLIGAGCDLNKIDERRAAWTLPPTTRGEGAPTNSLTGVETNATRRYNHSALDRAALEKKDDCVQIVKDHGGLTGQQILEMAGSQKRKPLERRGSAAGRGRCRSFGDIDRLRRASASGLDPLQIRDAFSSLPTAKPEPKEKFDPLAAGAARRQARKKPEPLAKPAAPAPA